MGLLRDPVATRSHHSWKNIATRYGRFCVQKRTEEGLVKNTKLRHRFFYLAEDMSPFRIIYSSHPCDFNDTLPAASPLTTVSGGAAANGLYPSSVPLGAERHTSSTTSSIGAAQTSTAAAGGPSSTPSTPSTNGAAAESSEGIVSGFLNWLTGSGEQRESASPTSVFFAPFSAPATPTERFTVATSSQLSGILEAWGLLMAAWEPEEAELNVLSFASPAMASPTSRGPAQMGGSNSNSNNRARSAAMAAAAARVPFCERWRRTYGRIEVMRAEAGMDGSAPSGTYDGDDVMDGNGRTPSSPSLNDSAGGFSFAETSPLNPTLPASRLRRVGAGGDNALASSMRGVRDDGGGAAGGGDQAAQSRSFAVRRHVHISDAYYSADSPAALLVAHFLDVVLVRVVDLLMWRDPQLTACCLGILISVYGYSAWASAVCFLGGDALAASSEYCARLYTRATSTSPFLTASHYQNLNTAWGGTAAATATAAAAGTNRAQDTLLAERLWWGAPLFMISVLAFPWTREQQRRTLSATDREHLRSVDHALRWLCSTAGDDDSDAAVPDTSSPLSTALSPPAVVVEVVRRVWAVLVSYRLPIAVLLVFNVLGAFATWEAILVLFLWPMLIVSVGLAGLVVATQCITNK